MKKQILNIGQSLTKIEQKQILGGLSNDSCSDQCTTDASCGHADLECFEGTCMTEPTWMCRKKKKKEISL